MRENEGRNCNILNSYIFSGDDCFYNYYYHHHYHHFIILNSSLASRIANLVRKDSKHLRLRIGYTVN